MRNWTRALGTTRRPGTLHLPVGLAMAGLLAAGGGSCATPPISPRAVSPTPVSPTPVSPRPVSPTPVSPTAVSPTFVSPTPSLVVRPSSTWTPRRPLEIQRVELVAGQPSQRLPLVAPADQSVLFLLYGRAGQTLSARLHATEGRASLRISGADASLWLDERAGSDHWAGTLTSSQDYLIEVIALEGRRFAGYLELALLDLTLAARPTSTP